MRVVPWVAVSFVVAIACSSTGSNASPVTASSSSTPTAPSSPTTAPMVAPARCAKRSSHLELGAGPTYWVYEGRKQKPGQPCLSVPASSFAVSIDSASIDTGGASSPTHNFAVYTDPTGAEQLYGSSIVLAGQRKTFTIPAIAAGVYYFQCDLHPGSMHGVLVVG